LSYEITFSLGGIVRSQSSHSIDSISTMPWRQ